MGDHHFQRAWQDNRKAFTGAHAALQQVKCESGRFGVELLVGQGFGSADSGNCLRSTPDLLFEQLMDEFLVWIGCLRLVERAKDLGALLLGENRKTECEALGL